MQRRLSAVLFLPGVPGRQGQPPSTSLAHGTLLGKHRLAFRTAYLRFGKLSSAFSAVHTGIAHAIASLPMPYPPLLPCLFAGMLGYRRFTERTYFEIHECARTALRAFDHLRLAVLACRQAHIAIGHEAFLPFTHGFGLSGGGALPVARAQTLGNARSKISRSNRRGRIRRESSLSQNTGSARTRSRTAPHTPPQRWQERHRLPPPVRTAGLSRSR